MTNYICINGKKAELTEEQMQALGIELPKPSPFERICNNANSFYEYYFINSFGAVIGVTDTGFANGNGNDDLRYRVGNYCADENLMRQRALHETLNRLLWRYSMEHDGDKIDWSSEWTNKYRIRYDHNRKAYEVEKNQFLMEINTVYFYSCSIALDAIKEIVEPFMKAHPEFKW